jgi:excisionase family DNA binding protein
MAAYATADPASPDFSEIGMRQVGGILDEFVELLAERVAQRLGASTNADDEWLDSRGAADHLGVHRDTLRRLAAEQAIPSEQDGPGCKLFFRRRDLDAWRCSNVRPLRAVKR